MIDVFPPDALTGHIAVVGMTGSGKTSTSKLIVEQGYRAGEHICIVDPIKSDWRGLISSADGSGPGLPFTILGGPYGHVPLLPSSGAAIAKVVASGELPYSILDTRQFPMGGLQQFFNDFAPALLDQVRVVVRLVLEEAHELAPKEKSGISGENIGVYHAKKLATAGRSLGVRLLVNSQRVQALHNAVLGSCSTLVVHRMNLPADQEPVVKWLRGSIKDKGIRDEIEESIPELADGEGWLCSGVLKIRERRQFPRIQTFDNSATPKGQPRREPTGRAQVNIEQLRALIGAAVTAAEVNDPKALHARIALLEKQLSAKPGAGGYTAADLAEARRAGDLDGHQRGYQSGHQVGWWQGRKDAAFLVNELGNKLQSPIASPSTEGAAAAADVPKPVVTFATAAALGEVARAAIKKVATAHAGGAGRRLLIALAQNPQGITPRKMGILADVTPGGSSWRAAMAGFRKAGHIEETGGSVRITAAGLHELGAYEPLPTGKALCEYWLSQMGATRRAIFEAIIAGKGRPIPAAAVARAAGIELGGSNWRSHMAQLRGLELVSGSTELRAAAELFE